MYELVDDGEIVEIDTSYFGIPEKDAEYVECIIRGKHVMDHGFTLWVLDVNGQLTLPGYSYSCILTPTFSIVKKEDLYANTRI